MSVMLGSIREAIMKGRLRTLVLFLRNPMIGYLAFIASVLLKNLGLYFGQADQRAVEYPWIFRQLALLAKGSIVLDVGCSESLLSHALIMRGYTVVGLDIRDFPFRSKHMMFVKSSVIDTSLPGGLFDGILIVSTIEHVGLEIYGQTVIDNGLDARAVRELLRVLKPDGLIMVTTPFIGGRQDRINPGIEKLYSFDGLKRLTEGIRVLRQDYFYPYRHGHVFRWIKLGMSEARNAIFAEPGIACLILGKERLRKTVSE